MGISSQIKGGIAENLVINDLIASNYSVYKAEFDVFGIDLVIKDYLIKNSPYISIQVKYRDVTESKDATKSTVIIEDKNPKADYLAVVSERFNNKIAYIPIDKTKNRFYISIRTKKAKSRNQNKIHYLEDYLKKPI
tara:strand:- start:1623 stop:2030 length:408 start_codon:yes stop_codon:yes gene_type:complete